MERTFFITDCNRNQADNLFSFINELSQRVHYFMNVRYTNPHNGEILFRFGEDEPLAKHFKLKENSKRDNIKTDSEAIWDCVLGYLKNRQKKLNNCLYLEKAEQNEQLFLNLVLGHFFSSNDYSELKALLNNHCSTEHLFQDMFLSELSLADFSKWVSVGKKMPDKCELMERYEDGRGIYFQKVLVYLSNGCIRAATFTREQVNPFKEKYLFIDEETQLVLENVTHWRELPQPPKE